MGLRSAREYAWKRPLDYSVCEDCKGAGIKQVREWVGAYTERIPSRIPEHSDDWKYDTVVHHPAHYEYPSRECGRCNGVGYLFRGGATTIDDILKRENEETHRKTVQYYVKASNIPTPQLVEFFIEGDRFINLDRYKEAVASCDKAIAINPDYAVAKENREIALKKLI